MSATKEAGLAVPVRDLPGGFTTPFVDKFGFVKNGLIIGNEIQRTGTADGLVISHKMNVSAGTDAAISFHSHLSLPKNEPPSLKRSLEVNFGQDYPRLVTDRPGNLHRGGDYRVVMSDGNLGSRRNGVVDINERQQPRMEIFNGKTLLYDSGAVVVAYAGGQRMEFRGFDPMPVYSDLIQATLKAASQFTGLVRGAVTEAKPEVQFIDVTNLRGPFGVESQNLLDTFTLKSAR